MKKRGKRTNLNETIRKSYEKGIKEGKIKKGMPSSDVLEDYEHKAEALGYARQNLNDAIKTGDLRSILGAIYGYTRAGAGNTKQVKEKITEALQKYVLREGIESLPRHHLKAIDNFLRQPSQKNLSSKFSIIIAFLGIVGALFFLSPNLTGNAIGSLNQIASNWVGIILFVFGLSAAFYFFENRA